MGKQNSDDRFCNRALSFFLKALALVGTAEFATGSGFAAGASGVDRRIIGWDGLHQTQSYEHRR